MAQLQIERRGRVAVVTLDDPGRRNALNLELSAEIVAAFDELETDDGIGAVVVTGAPPAFCAGADLTQLGESQRDGLHAIYSGFLRVARSPLPTVAAVNGAAVGAGMNLALAADVRIASLTARFDTRFLDLGLHPGGGHTWVMQRIVGPQATAATVLFGQVLDAAAAMRVGLVWDVADDAVARSVEIAARAADGPPELVRRLKASIAAMPTVASHDEAVELELDPQVWSINQPEFAARLAAMQARISSTAGPSQ
jgi:enoyl-CoA hydratase